MNSWQILSEMALLGSERHREPVQEEGKLGHILQEIFATETCSWEKRVLDSAALLAFYRLSGAKPITAVDNAAEPAGRDEFTEVSANAGRHLFLMLSDSRCRNVLPEWLALAAEAQMRVPHLLLPDLLNAGRQDRSLRPLVLRVIDDRGRWLAAQNSDWRYATAAGAGSSSGETDTVWEDGAFEARILYLQELRRNDPEKALHLLNSVWGSEGARERGQLLEVLQINLSMIDEPFLEQYLDDRSKEVRKIAAALLSSLPESRLCRRMINRVAPLLTLKPRTGLLSKLGGKKFLLEVVLPEGWDPQWDRDGIQQKPPAGKGEKGWWLEQIIAAVPPSHWMDLWKLSAAEVVESAIGHDFQELLVAGWSLAAIRHRDGEWAEALISTSLSKEISLWEAVSLPKRETLIRSLIADAKDRDGRMEALQRLSLIPGTWSHSLTQEVLAAINAHLRVSASDYRLMEVLRICALRMKPYNIDEIESSFAPGLVEGASMRKQLEEALETLRFRSDIMQEFNKGR